VADGRAFVPAAPPRRPERWWLHALLLVLTFGTTTYVGANFAVNFRPSLLTPGADVAAGLGALFRGAITFSLPLLLILLAHEMGHYLTCRRYGIDASPPYFIPFPSLVGTMGAFIRIREPIRNKSQLFDVGVAGPIAGFAVALPLLAWGIAHSRSNPSPILAEGTILFRYPLLVTLFQKLVLGSTFTSADTIEHPVFIAAWFGLFVTALNLLPLGQLDGGHALYAVFGRHQRTIAIPLLIVLAFMGLKWPGWWIWVAFTLFTGLRHPPVLDEDSPLDFRRKLVAAALLLIFVVCFAPIPLELI
jgi:membrane-associated protease RseP (regulator of RpoE activity)